jgi:hypothetical protein
MANIVFKTPTKADVIVTEPPYSLRYDAKDAAFKFGFDDYIRNEEGQSILPWAVFVGYSQFYGELRQKTDPATGEVSMIEEEIDFLYWVPLKSPRNQHPLIPQHGLVRTAIVTKSRDNIKRHFATLQNKGLSPAHCVSSFIPAKYDTKNRKGVGCLNFTEVLSEKLSKDELASLKVISAWVEANYDSLLEIISQPYENGLKSLEDHTRELLALQQEVNSLPPLSSGADFESDESSIDTTATTTES